MEIASAGLTAHVLLDPQDDGTWIGEAVGPGLVGVNRNLTFAPGALARFAEGLFTLARNGAGTLTLAAETPGAFDVRLQGMGGSIWVYATLNKPEGDFTHVLATRFEADVETLAEAAEDLQSLLESR